MKSEAGNNCGNDYKVGHCVERLESSKKSENLENDMYRAYVKLPSASVIKEVVKVRYVLIKH
jgi:hypothetical protein